MQEVQPDWCGLAEQSVMVVGTLSAQGAWRAGLQESKVAAGKQLCGPRPP